MGHSPEHLQHESFPRATVLHSMGFPQGRKSCHQTAPVWALLFMGPQVLPDPATAQASHGVTAWDPPWPTGGYLLHCGPPWAGGGQLPHHGLNHGLQENLAMQTRFSRWKLWEVQGGKDKGC